MKELVKKNTLSRRNFLVAMGATMAAPVIAPALAAERKITATNFPHDFIWGVATSGHQVEGNNINSDLWYLEQMKPTTFKEPSGDAINNFELWQHDLDLVKGMGLNSYRFSIEWSRIEPEPGMFSIAMLNHYKAIIDGCRQRGLKPMASFNHFTAPRWFSAMGGWKNDKSPELFANYCRRTAEHLAYGLEYAFTFNEPNLVRLIENMHMPQFVWDMQRKMLEQAATELNVELFSTLNVCGPGDIAQMSSNLIKAHKAGRSAIKAVRPDLPVGVTLAMFDDQASGKNSIRDQKRDYLYGDWFEAVKGDDFLGVQNYERVVWGDKGSLPVPEGVTVNDGDMEVYPASLAGAVNYAHQVTGIPILVSEHGVNTSNDAIRSDFITESLQELKTIMTQGVPVLGYVHWSMFDNFEWVFGYKPKFGLHSVNRATFERTAKPSASTFGTIAKNNGW